MIEQDWQTGADTYTGLFDFPGLYSVRVDARNQYGGTNATALTVEVTDARERMVELNHPEAAGRDVFITRVNMSATYTEVVFTVRSRSTLCWYEKGNNSPYLLVQSIKHSLRSTKLVAFCEYNIEYPADARFSLTFDPIPLNSLTFDLIVGEAAEQGEARFFNYFNVEVPINP